MHLILSLEPLSKKEKFLSLLHHIGKINYLSNYISNTNFSAEGTKSGNSKSTSMLGLKLQQIPLWSWHPR